MASPIFDRSDEHGSELEHAYRARENPRLPNESTTPVPPPGSERDPLPQAMLVTALVVVFLGLAWVAFA